MSISQRLTSFTIDPIRLALLQQIEDYYLSQTHSFNFTAHRAPKDFEILNTLDSLMPFLQYPELVRQSKKVLDIGTGGGFPGIPLATLFPDLDFTLSDSVGKKMDLLRNIVSLFTLTNVHIRPGRLEELAQISGLRESFDIVVSRAVAKWATLLEYALPFVAVGGVFYAYQGEAVLSELDASEKVISQLGGKLSQTLRYTLPEEKGERYLICIQKTSSTPASYPRMVGIPKKTPLSF